MGDSNGAFNYGSMLFKGIKSYLLPNRRKAIDYITKAANNNHPFAIYYVGILNSSFLCRRSSLLQL